MAEHPNALAVRQLLDAFTTGDLAAVEAGIDPDCTWRFPGREGALAGTHVGRTAVFDLLGRVMALTEGTFAFDLVDVLASDERAVVLFRGRGARADGRRLDNPTALVLRLRDGRAVEVDEYVWDLPEVEAFWS